GHLGAGQIVVDGRRHAHHRQTRARQRQRAGLRAVATDDDQPVDAPVRQVAEPLGPDGVLLELGEARAAQDGAAALQDVADVAGAQRIDLAFDQAGVAVANPENLPALRDAGSDHGPNGGVHAGGVAPAGQDGDLSVGHRRYSLYHGRSAADRATLAPCPRSPPEPPPPNRPPPRPTTSPRPDSSGWPTS